MNDKLVQVFATAARCADCPDPACVRACPEKVDLRLVFDFLASETPLPVVWKLNELEAIRYVDDAIETSYTPWFQ